MPKKNPTPFRWPDEYDLDIYAVDEDGDPVEEHWISCVFEAVKHVHYLQSEFPELELRIQCYAVKNSQTDTSVWFNLTPAQLLDRARAELTALEEKLVHV